MDWRHIIKEEKAIKSIMNSSDVSEIDSSEDKLYANKIQVIRKRIHAKKLGALLFVLRRIFLVSVFCLTAFAVVLVIIISNNHDLFVKENSSAEIVDTLEQSVKYRKPNEIDHKSTDKIEGFADEKKTGSSAEIASDMEKSIKPESNNENVSSTSNSIDDSRIVDSAYIDAYKELLDFYADESSSYQKYTLIDINLDGVPELLMTKYAGGFLFTSDYYTMVDSAAKCVASSREGSDLMAYCYFWVNNDQHPEGFLAAIDINDGYDQARYFTLDNNCIIHELGKEKVVVNIRSDHFLYGKYLQMCDFSDDYLLLHPDQVLIDPTEDVYSDWYQVRNSGELR